MVKGIWLLAAVLAVVAGWTDWRWRRIPNWLTVPGLFLGLAANSVVGGWAGAKSSLLGAGLGLGLLLPFVLIRSFGGGDWKLVGALGAFLGPYRLAAVLVVTIVVNAVMALIMVVRHKRVRQTLRNLGVMMASLATFHLPGPAFSVDNPEALKVPFGVAVAITMVAFAVLQLWRPA